MRFWGFLLALALSALTSSCKAVPVAGTATVRLRLDPIVARRIQLTEDPLLVDVVLTGPSMTRMTASTFLDQGGALQAVTLKNVPTGKNRVVSLNMKKIDGIQLPNSTLRAVFDLTGDSTIQVNWQTTPAGSIIQHLLDKRNSDPKDPINKSVNDLVPTLDNKELQRQIDRIKIEANLPHYMLIDSKALADAVFSDRSLSRLPSMCPTITPSTLKVSLKGLPEGVGATVQVFDPLSPLQTDLRNGTHLVVPIWPYSPTGTIPNYLVEVRVPGYGTHQETLSFGSGQTTALSVDCNNWKGWQLRTPMPAEAVREGMGSFVTSFDPKKIVLVWGYDSTFARESIVSSIERFYPNGNSWDPSTPTTDDRLEPLKYCAMAFGDAAYVFGGLDGSGIPVDSVQELTSTSTTMTWNFPSSIPLLPRARAYGKAVVFPGTFPTFYLVGGIGTNGLPLAAVDRFNKGDCSDWSTPTSMPTARADLGVCILSGKIYAVGGTTGSSEPSDKVECYDPTKNTWTTLAPLPTPRFGLQAVAFGEKLYAIGGVRKNPFNPSILERVPTVEIFDPTKNAWAPGPPLLNARAHFAAHVIPDITGRDVLYVVAGENGLPVLATEALLGGTP